MEFRKLGNSGLKVTEIGLGGNNFGTWLREEQSIATINQAVESGINFIDTADMYGKGRSEEFIGKALAGKRSDVIIATKCGMPVGKTPNDAGASRYHIMRSVEASLRRLNTDYIDLYYIHAPDVTTPIEETLRALDDLVRSGKVRYIGCSNFVAWQLCEALWTSRTCNLNSFVVIESMYNLLSRGLEREVAPCAQEYGLGVIPWGPLAGGVLTGKYERGNPPPAGSRLANPGPRPVRPANIANLPPAGPAVSVPVLTDAIYDKVEKLVKFATERGHKPAELAIAWLLGHSWIPSVIAGATSPEQVKANVAAGSWKLTAEDMAKLEQ